MKKIALTSLLAVFAVSGANAANVIDGNPLYMPGQNHFYSVTDFGTHTKNDTPWVLGEEFGYGILDNLAVNVETSMTENKAFDEFSEDGLSMNVAFRALDMGGWKLDAVAGYGFTGIYVHPKVAGGDAWFDKDNTLYTWTAGVRGGFVGSNWTVAGRTLYKYTNLESFNWNDEGVRALELGLTGQYVFDSNWSVLADVEYSSILGDMNMSGAKAKNEGVWAGELAVNYNIDATKYVGLYINGSLNHHDGAKADEWGWEDGFGYGVKFGIDF